nr:15153_t:CDS:2 [Entrophospora candida]
MQAVDVLVYYVTFLDLDAFPASFKYFCGYYGIPNFALMHALSSFQPFLFDD